MPDTDSGKEDEKTDDPEEKLNGWKALEWMGSLQ